MKTTRTVACLLWFSIFCLTGLVAQTTQWGTPRFHSALRASNESVYANNLDGTVSIPLVSKGGRGISFYLTRVYNSAIYTSNGAQFQPVGTQPTSSSSVSPYWGWLTQSPAGTMALNWQGYSCQYLPPNCPYCTPQTEFYQAMDIVFYDPSGRAHQFDNLGITTSNPCNTGQATGSGSDGEGWVAYGDLNNSANDTVTAPDGTVYHYSGLVEDTNGNEISQTNSSSESDFYDTTGLETAKVVTSTNCVNPVDGQTYPQCVSYERLEPGSTSAYATVYTEYDENLSVNSGSCSNLSAYTGTATVPAYGVLGQYTSGSHWYYQFSYDTAGRISAITYPTGGTTSWSYGSLCTFKDGGPDSVTKTVKDNTGATLSVITLTRATGQTTETVQDGSNHLLSKQVITYDTSSGLPTDQKDYDTNGTTVLKEVTWSNSGGYPQTVFTYLNGTKVSEADLSFDSYGNLHQRVVKDLARDASGATQQITTIDYLTSSTYTNLNIIDKPTDETVTSFSGTVLAKTTINYDNYATAIAASGDPEHDSAYSTSYTTRANPTSIVREVASAATLTTSFDYNDAGQVIATHDPNGNTVTTTYNSAVCGGVYPASQQAPGGSISTTYDCGTGLLAQTQDQNGATASAQYDTLGRLTQATAADGGVTTYSYDDPNNTKVASSIDGSSWLTRYQVSDGYGRPIYAQTQAPSNWDTVETVYDGLGRVAEVSNPYNTTHAPAAGTQFTTTSYDGLGRPLQITAVDGSHTTYAYSQNAVQVTDAKGVQKVLQNDGLGHLWKVCEVSGQSGSAACGTVLGANGFLTTYTYDMAGRLTSVQQGTQSHTWSYDELGRALSHADPESGTTHYTYDSATDSTCANGSSQSAGDLVLVADASGMKTCLKYDPWHRMMTKTQYVDASHTYQYSYAWDGTESNGKGRVASATSPWATDSFAYDALGRPTTVTEALSGFGSSPSTAYTYNYLGEVVGQTAPSARQFGRTYDVEGRLTRLYDMANNYSFLSNRTFDAAGHLTGQAFSTTLMQMTAAYNNRLQPYKFTYTAPNNNTMTLLYHWGATIDSSGNVTTADNDGTLRELEMTLPGIASNKTMQYTYDDLGRLATATEGNSALNVSFTLDAFGNRNRRDPYNGSGLQEIFPADPATNRIQGFTYDAAGRVLAGSWAGASRSFFWDPDGKLLAYSDTVNGSTSYGYDAFGRRVIVSENGVNTWYFYGAGTGAHPLAEYSAGSLWQTNFEADGKVWGYIQNNGNVEYYGLSALGTAHLNVNGSNNALSTGTMYPYGEDGVDVGTEYKFTNQRRDPNGIDHFWMRSYSATLGRWLTPDPAGLAAVDPTNPQSWNRYAYVLNNPASIFDPLGLSGCDRRDGSTSPLNKEQCIKQGNIWVNSNGTTVTVSGGMGGTVPLAGADPSGAAQLAQDRLTLGGVGSSYDGTRGTQGNMPGSMQQAGSQNTATIGPANPKSIPSVPPDPAFCGTYRDGTGAGDILYSICMNFPNFPSQKWNYCVRGKLMNQYVRNGNPLDLIWYLFVDHPADFMSCPVH